MSYANEWKRYLEWSKKEAEKDGTQEMSVEEYNEWFLRKRFEWFKREGLPCSDKELFFPVSKMRKVRINEF